MDIQKIVIGYLSAENLLSKKNPDKGVLVLDTGTNGSVRSIIVFESNTVITSIEFIYDELTINSKFNLFFSRRMHYHLIRYIVYLALKKYLSIENLTEDRKKETWKLVSTNLLGLSETKSALRKDNFIVYNLIDLSKEMIEMVENSIASVWNIGYLQRTLMNSFVLMTYDSAVEDFSHKLAQSIGCTVGELKAYIKLLRPKQLVNEVGMLRDDNGVYEKIGEIINDEYGLLQKIKIDDNEVSGIEYLHLSHFSNEKKKYLSATRCFFETFLPPTLVKYNSPENLDHAFKIQYGDKWEIFVFCDAHQRAVSDKEVGEVAMLELQNLKSHSETAKNEFYLICGPSFSERAIDRGINTGIYFADSFSILKLAKIFGELSLSKKTQLVENFPRIFSGTGGFVSVREHIEGLIS